MKARVYYRLFESDRDLATEHRLNEMGNVPGEIRILEGLLEKDSSSDDTQLWRDRLEEYRGLLAEYETLLDELPARKFVRLTLRQVSFMDKAHYWQLMQEGFSWFKEEFGLEPTESTPGNVYANSARNFLYYRAELFSAMDRSHKGEVPTYFMEEARIPYGKKPEEWEAWRKVPMPEEWSRLQDNQMPEALFDMAAMKNREINAGSLSSMPQQDFLSYRLPKATLVQ